MTGRWSRAGCGVARETEPSSALATAPRPWEPTTTSCASNTWLCNVLGSGVYVLLSVKDLGCSRQFFGIRHRESDVIDLRRLHRDYEGLVRRVSGG